MSGVVSFFTDEKTSMDILDDSSHGNTVKQFDRVRKPTLLRASPDLVLCQL